MKTSKTFTLPTVIRWISVRQVQLFTALFIALIMSGVSARATDTVELWQSASAGFTNQTSWSPQITTPGGTNWPNNFNGAGVDYSMAITGAGGNASGDVCLYTNTDVNGTNVVGQLAIGGTIGAGAGGGCISNAFIMTGGMLTCTDFTASAAAGYAFTIGGENVSQTSLLDTNYFIMTGGIFNATNSSGGNNWIGTESNSISYVYFDGGTVNLDGMFMGGYGSGTVTINGSTVNIIPAPSGGGTPGAISLGWEPAPFFTLNLMSGVLNITNQSPSINFHANTKSSGVFTVNVSGGTLNANTLNFGNTTTGVATNLMIFSGGNINLGSGGIESLDTANNTNLIIMSGGTFSTLPGQNWTFSSSANPIINIITNTGTNVVFAPLAGQFITLSGIISGPGTLNVAGPGTTVLKAAMGFTGGLAVSGGTLAISTAQTQSLGLNISSGGNLQINNVNNALVDNPISLPGGSSLIFSNTGAILFPNTVTGGGNLIMQGGAVTNTGNLQYTGDTFVNADDLVVNGSGALSGPVISVVSGGTLDVSQLASLGLGNGQTLMGNGTIIGPSSGNINFNNGSTLAEGLSATNTYTLTINNNLVFAAGSTNYVVVNKSPAIANDEVIGLNSVTMGCTIAVTNIGSTPLAAGDAIPLFSATSYNTNGFNIVPATPGAGLAWAITNGTLYVLGGVNPNAPVITNQPVSAVLNPGTAFTNSVAASGAQPFYYQWFQSPSDTPIPGATNSTLIFNPVVAADATNYFVEVTNIDGSAFSTVASISVNSTPVILTQYPITYTNIANTNFMNLYAGANPTFSVSASSVQPASVFYQWYTNGMGIHGATNGTLNLTNVPATLLNIVCVVTNGGGAATDVVWAASVLGDPMNTQGLAPYPQAVLALNPMAYWRLNEGPDNGSGDEGIIAYDYAGGNDALYNNAVLDNQGYNPTTDPSDASAEFGSSSFPTNSYAGSVGSNVDFAVPSGSNAEFSVECWVNFTRNTVCGLVTKGYGNGGEEFSLDNDSGSLPRFLVRTASGAGYIATSIGAPFSPTPGTWYNLVGVCDEANSNVLFYVNGVLNAITNVSALYQGGIINDSSNYVIIGARPASLAAALVNSNGNQTVGYMNDVALFNYALSPSQIQNEFLQGSGAPFISQQPVGTYIGQGSNLTLAASVSGAPQLSYQWYETNLTALTGHAVAGQTNATLVISNIQSSDDYYLYVSNPYGTTNSAIAVIGVYSSPLLTGQFPITYNTVLNTNFMTVYAGADPTFSITALYYGTPYYRWFTNGVAFGSATNASFTWANVQVATNTVYCIVTNSLGSATSEVWSASVIADPTNSSNGLAPYPQSVLALNPIGYWRLNEGNDNGNGNDGYLALDYAGGNDGIYTNVTLGNTGYNPTTDPADTSVDLGFAAINNCDINYVGTNIDFGTPAGSNAEFSVECWVNFTSHSVCGLITKGYGNGGEEFSLDADAAGGANFRFFVRNASNTTYTAQSTFTPALNTWYHMAGVCDEANSNVAFYVDGQLAGIVAIPSASGIISDSGYNLIFGARSSSLANAQANNQNNQTIGNMNDVAVFKSALSPGQVANQYDAGGGTIAPYFVPTTPATNASAIANSTLTIPVTAVGTPPIGYLWTNLNTSATIAANVTNATTLSATLNYANVPISWNSNQLELIVTNAYGTTNVFVTLSVGNSINSNPTNILFSVTNNQLKLSWPADHTGWQLQAQTNSVKVGLSTNWANVGGSITTNAIIVPLSLTNGSVFYRLVYP